MTIKIRGALKLVDIAQVFPNDYNYNEMSVEMVEKEAEAFRRFGVIRSILVRRVGKNYIIIDGEHRYKILRDAGVAKIQVRDLGVITDEEAKVLTMALDEIKGQPDFIKAAELFAGIKTYTLEEISTFLPYKPVELQTMIDAIDFDYSEYGSPTDPYEDDMVSEYGTIMCRVPRDEAPELDKEAEALAHRLGVSDKKEPVQLGKLFTHLLKEAVANSK
jgi:hypothetical protein